VAKDPPRPEVSSIREPCRVLRKGLPAVEALIASGELPTLAIAGSRSSPAFAVDRFLGNAGGQTPGAQDGWITWQAAVTEQMAGHFQAVARRGSRG
jgi:hypothetical protein